MVLTRICNVVVTALIILGVGESKEYRIDATAVIMFPEILKATVTQVFCRPQSTSSRFGI